MKSMTISEIEKIADEEFNSTGWNEWPNVKDKAAYKLIWRCGFGLGFIKGQLYTLTNEKGQNGKINNSID